MGGGEIRLVGLVKRFEDVTAVDGIDLDVPGGEFFALLGPSGCGKTTTLRLVAGFEQPTDGRILLDGVDMARTPPHKRKVNTVFQSYALFPFLSVADNVAFGLRFQDVDKAEARRRVAEALALVQLQGLERRRPAQLSGGQQQRVALARALVLEPVGAAAGRAPGRPRRQAAQDPPGRAEGAPGGGRDHLRVRDPRPGGGPHHVGPPGRDGRRPHRAGRPPDRAVRGAGHHLCGRVPGGGEPVLGHGRAVRRRRPLPAAAGRVRAGGGRRRHRRHRRGPGGHPARAGAAGGVRVDRPQPGPRHGRAAGLPGPGHPAGDPPGQRRVAPGPGPEPGPAPLLAARARPSPSTCPPTPSGSCPSHPPRVRLEAGAVDGGAHPPASRLPSHQGPCDRGPCAGVGG